MKKCIKNYPIVVLRLTVGTISSRFNVLVIDDVTIALNCSCFECLNLQIRVLNDGEKLLGLTTIVK